MKIRHLFLSFLFLVTVSLLGGCAGPASDSPERCYKDGQEALAAENFAEAAAAFEKAASFGPLMLSYCLAREQEALAQTAFASDDADQAVPACAEAISGYTAISLFRDTDTRASDCRNLLYTKSTDWMNRGLYAQAAAGFDALGGWQDSAGLAKYCRASLLLAQNSRVEAAALFSEIPDVLDSAAQAETARAQAYEEAVSLRDHGDPLAAVDAFRALGDYRDAPQQAESTTVLLIRSLLAKGSYAESLDKLSRLTDLSVFPAADAAEAESVDIFLRTLIGVWLNAHARVMNGFFSRSMNGFFSRSLLQSYIEPGGELEGLLQAELPDDLPAENYGFVFNEDGQVESLLKLDDGFLAARVHGTGSSYGDNASGNAMNATVWVLLDTRGYYPVALAVLPV